LAERAGIDPDELDRIMMKHAREEAHNTAARHPEAQKLDWLEDRLDELEEVKRQKEED